MARKPERSAPERSADEDEFATDMFAAAPLPVASLDAAQRLACVRLIRSENVGPVTFRALINHYGGARAALEALPEIAARSGRKRAIRICSRQAAEAELEAAAAAGAVPLFTIEPGYPALLAQVEAPPPLLYVKGNVALLNQQTIAIVGSRDASAAGQRIARDFASGLGAAGWAIVSGLARGIDAAAHQAAIATGTLAVMAGGIDVVYPPEHAELHGEIGERGCLVSELPPGFQPRGQDFPRRNRIISGLSSGVVVVEAARRSGTLITARFAGEQGRDVFAVPGHPLDPRAEGTNQLLKDGAYIATEVEDILKAIAPVIEGFTDRTVAAPVFLPPVEARASVPKPGQSDRDAVLSALGPAPIAIDEVSRATGLPARAVQIVLMELSLGGKVIMHGSQLVSLRIDASGEV